MAQSLGTGAQGKESRGPFSIVNAAWATGSARESSARQVRGRNRGGDPFRGRQWPAPSAGRSRNGCLPITPGWRRTSAASPPGSFLETTAWKFLIPRTGRRKKDLLTRVANVVLQFPRRGVG